MKKRKFLDTVKIVYEGIQIPWVIFIICTITSFLMANAMIKTASLTAGVVDAKGQVKTAELVSFVIFTIIGSACAITMSYTGSLLTQKINIAVRDKLWQKILKLPLSFYDGEAGEGLVSRMSIDCDKAAGYLTSMVQFASAIYGLYLGVRSMYNFSPILTLYSALIIPLSLLLLSLTGKLYAKVVNNFYSKKADLMTYLIERVRNFRLIHTSNMTKNEVENGQKKMNDIFTGRVKVTLVDDVMASLMTINTVGLIVIAFVIGSTKVASGELTVGKVVGFYTVASMASIRISSMIVVYGTIAECNGVFAKIADVLTSEEEKVDGRPLDLPDADLTIKNVDFAYGVKEVLHDVNCVIPMHQVTAIIGENGAGKTTLFKLLERMYEPTSGEILFGDTNIKEFNLESYRKVFALVAQDSPILSGTIRENLTYGCVRKVSDEELVEACKQANIYDVIASLDKGFDSKVEPNGANFSGGQRQCLAIARAILRNPDYLLLDEATANLDAISQQQVTSALHNLMVGRTTIMIGHSLGAINFADNIIIMKDGKVVDEGSVETLSKTSQAFKEFVLAQVNKEMEII